MTPPRILYPKWLRHATLASIIVDTEGEHAVMAEQGYRPTQAEADAAAPDPEEEQPEAEPAPEAPAAAVSTEAPAPKPRRKGKKA